MRMFTVILAVVALAVAGTTMAADVPSNTLGQMGIQGMQSVSDAEGMAIRGMGWGMGFWQDNQIVTENGIMFVGQSHVENVTNEASREWMDEPPVSWQQNVAELIGEHTPNLAGGLQAEVSQTSSIYDEQPVVSRLHNIRQKNKVDAVGGDGWTSGDTGPTLHAIQSNFIETRAPGNLQTNSTGIGLSQFNWAEQRISVNREVRLNQSNSVSASRTRLQGFQENISFGK